MKTERLYKFAATIRAYLPRCVDTTITARGVRGLHNLSPTTKQKGLQMSSAIIISITYSSLRKNYSGQCCYFIAVLDTQFFTKFSVFMDSDACSLI